MDLRAARLDGTWATDDDANHTFEHLMSTDNYPLITLHPIVDHRERWVAILLQAEAPAVNFSFPASLFGEKGLLEALGDLPCVLPLMSVETLGPEVTEFLPVERAILRIPVAQCQDPAQGENLARLSAAGFRLMAEGLPTQAALASGVTLFGINRDALPSSADKDIAAALERLPGPHLALAIDDPAQFERHRDLGFRWLAGNYPLNVSATTPSTVNPGRAIMLKLLGQVVADAESRDIETTLKQDPQLSYQLLRLVNSVAFELTTKIGSFGQAITLLGRRQLQRWLQLLLYARPPNEKDHASPLMPRAALRAGLMESLAKQAGCGKEVQEHAFMVGMFSLLGPMFGQSSAEVIKPLHLAEEVRAALLARQGRLGAWLSAIEASEGGPSQQARAALTDIGVDFIAWTEAQVDACRWAIQVSREA